ncbi:CrcB family protein [Macrococcus brunensis]|uniref:Fluoride-specific ion channel FluC n=1 Tax=Macrococcus brunensis TaxID=198483 RepID=A0A4R6BFS7_9STAP|nr:CrcB family protein [Macrococcus brunensis]TDL98704.1 CrcB family protein [Macrococcus brunensis]ULG75285.1 CrcB family protein [Macrococcus brunensis]
MVGLGAMLGAIIRVYLSQFNGQFPWVTLGINITGSLILGLISHFDSVYLFIGTGMMGGLTTFSTFALESIQLFENDRTKSLLYVLLSIILPILGYLTGMLIL